jgi:hypothetical protein
MVDRGNPMLNLNRRQLVVGGSVVIVLGASAAITFRDRPPEDPVRNLIDQLVGDNPQAEAIGGRFLARETPPSTEEVLSRVVLANAEPGGARAQVRAIRLRITDDYRLDRTVAVDDWILSITEAQLYALASLRA